MRSTVTNLDTGRTRSGQSEAIFPEFLPFLAFTHLFQNVDVTIDRIGGGNAEVAYTIRGTRDGGATWELTRSSHYASPDDISFASVIEVGSTAEALQAFDDEDIQVTSIDVPTLAVEKAFEQYNVKGLLVWNGSRYVAREFVAARPGRTIKLRAVLKPVHTTGTKNVDLSLKVPANARRGGWIEVVGGGSVSPDLPCFIEDEECGEDTALTFDQLLTAFENQPRGDAVVARLRLGDAGNLRGPVVRAAGLDRPRPQGHRLSPDPLAKATTGENRAGAPDRRDSPCGLRPSRPVGHPGDPRRGGHRGGRDRLLAPVLRRRRVQAGPETLIGAIQIRLQAKPGWAAAQGKSAVVVLSTELSADLISEGLWLLVHVIQTQRKEMARARPGFAWGWSPIHPSCEWQPRRSLITSTARRWPPNCSSRCRRYARRHKSRRIRRPALHRALSLNEFY